MHPLVARLLVNRGVIEAAAARQFLACDLRSLSEPGLFIHMRMAVDRIRKAVASGENIIVFGDYDVDGVTGSSLLFLVLSGLNASVHCYIPDRMTEGYGLNKGALEHLKGRGAGLVITVDCGITAHDEATLAKSLGIDLIITDHHEFEKNQTPPPGTTDSGAHDVSAEFVLPDAYAILHPALISPDALPGVREGVGVLTGVGVAFKLAQALLDVPADDDTLTRYLDLVALGTIADVGRITGENRVLVRHGLERLSSSLMAERPGLAALKKVGGLDGKKIGVGAVGFTIAPRINASGRLDRADAAFKLLTTSSSLEAENLAAELDAVNRERQAVEEEISEQARRQCSQTDTVSAGALVLSSEIWHPGVIGIVASRIAEEFYRPTALVSIKDGIGKGSARSIPGFDLHAGLSECRDLLSGFGGHKYAAGFTIEAGKIPEFRERLSSLVLEQMGLRGFVRTLMVDSAIKIDELTRGLMEELEKLAPFGQGNPEPRLGAKGLKVISSRIVGRNHLKLQVRQGNGSAFGAIAFNRGELLGNLVKNGSRIAAVFTPRLNTWNNSTNVELDIRDIKKDA